MQIETSTNIISDRIECFSVASLESSSSSVLVIMLSLASLNSFVCSKFDRVLLHGDSLDTDTLE